VMFFVMFVGTAMVNVSLWLVLSVVYFLFG